MSSLLDDQPALATIARRFLALPAGRREEFALRVARQDPAHLELLERAVAEELAVGWRATPATMAHHLTGGERKLWRYVRLLGERYVQAYDGIKPHQQWWIASQYGKPVECHEPVLMGDGSLRPLGAIVVGDLVVTHLGRVRPVLAVYEQGEIPVVRLTTTGGRSITAAPDHPFLTPTGWTQATDLRAARPGYPGDVLGVVVPDALGATDRLAEEFRLAGYFIGDGSITAGEPHNQSCLVTCADAVEAEDLHRCAEKMGWAVHVGPPRPTAYRCSFRRGAGQRVAEGPRQWLRDAGIAGANSHTKRVPIWVFTAPPEMVAEFIGAYFACDGSVTRAGGIAQGRAVEFYSMSRPLLEDLRSLLARLGIFARLRGKHAEFVNFAGGPVESFRLGVTGSDAIARFAALIPVHHAKAERLAGLGVARQQFDARWLPDEVKGVSGAGVAACRCLQVADDSSFVVRDVAVHNTTTLMDAVNWTLDRDPTKRIMYVSYDANKAVEEGGKARDFAREHSGDLRFQLRDDQAARGRWATEQGGGLYCVGIMGGIIGWPVDVLLLDDLLKGWEWAHSDAIRQKVFNVYRSQCRFRMQSHTDPIIVAGTRMHYDDVQARLLALSRSDPAADQWDVLRLPTVAEECDPASPDELLHEPDPLGREPGELLEPDRFPAQEVAARRATAGSYLWNVMEQQRGVPEEGNEILRSWWRVDENLPPQFDEIVVSWDCKLKDKESGDFVVGGTWGRVGSAYWLYAILRGQWNQPTTENAIALAAVREPRARLHVVENTGNGPEVMTALREPKPDYEVSDAVAGLLGMTAAERVAVQELRRRGVPGIVPENVPAQNKAVRMRAHSGLVEAGNVHLWARMAGLAAFLDELSAFPRGAHDDQVDMTSQALKRLRHGTATVHSAASTPMPPTQVQRQPGAGVVGRASRLDIGRVR